MKKLLLILFVLCCSLPMMTQEYFYVDTPRNSFAGDEYYFSVFVPLPLDTTCSVYFVLEYPDLSRNTFQLDLLRHKDRESFLWYSCVLVFGDVGAYRVFYYLVTAQGIRYDYPQVCNFIVF